MPRPELKRSSNPAADPLAHPRIGVPRLLYRARMPMAAMTSLCLLAFGFTGAEAGQDAAGWVPPGEELISLVAATRPELRHAVRYTDDWQAEEYARVSSLNMQLEYLYVTANMDNPVALASSFDLARAVGLFRHNRQGIAAWGNLGRVEKLGGTLFYRPYRLANQSCFGFEGELEHRAEAPYGQPAAILLGYGCRDTGTLTVPSIEAVLDSIGIRRVATAQLPSLLSAESAVDFVHGKADADHGLTSFPLLLAQHYTLG